MRSGGEVFFVVVGLLVLFLPQNHKKTLSICRNRLRAVFDLPTLDSQGNLNVCMNRLQKKKRVSPHITRGWSPYISRWGNTESGLLGHGLRMESCENSECL